MAGHETEIHRQPYLQSFGYYPFHPAVCIETCMYVTILYGMLAHITRKVYIILSIKF
jgi:hypothetical protein